MGPEILATLELIAFAAEMVRAAEAGELSPAELRERQTRLSQKVLRANDAWEASLTGSLE